MAAKVGVFTFLCAIFVTAVAGGRFTVIHFGLRVPLPDFNLSYSWMVSIRKQIGEQAWDHKCGGVYIGSRIVLTAAHCLTSDVEPGSSCKDSLLDPKSFVVTYGDPNWKSAQARSVGVEAFAVHPQCTKAIILDQSGNAWPTKRYDVGLILLKEALSNPAGTELASARLTDETTSKASLISMKKPAVVLGWGETAPSRWTTWLNFGHMKVVRDEKCMAQFGGSDDDWSDKLCTEGADGDISHCQGDSGGPLVAIADANGTSAQIGVVTFGPYGCADGPYASAFAWLGAPGVHEWISETSHSLSGGLKEDKR